MGTFPKYGPITEEINHVAYNIACSPALTTEAVNSRTRQVAEIIYGWYVKGLVAGINLSEES